MRVLLLISLLASTLAAGEGVPSKPAGRPSHLNIQSATLITGSGAPVQLRNVEAEIAPREQQPKPTIIYSGSAFLTSQGLTKLLQDKLSSTDLKDFKVQTKNGNKAKISATTKKAGLPVPFSIEGPVTLTADGMLRMEIKSEKAAGMPIKALADSLGLDPQSSVKTKQGRGFRIEKDAVFIEPNQLLGVTAQGRVTRTIVNDRGLTLIFGRAPTKVAAKR
jgi:hypothetical protein